jgi:hypothetical protein
MHVRTASFPSLVVAWLQVDKQDAMSDAITNMLRVTLFEGGDVGERVHQARLKSSRLIVGDESFTVATLCKLNPEMTSALPAAPGTWVQGPVPSFMEPVLDGEGKPITETMEVLKYL